MQAFLIMKKKTATSKKKASAEDSKVVKTLGILLADTYALMGQIHTAHWNVEGPEFFSLHHAFEAQYKDVFSAVDGLAERIRGLGAYAPGGLKTLADLSSIKELEIGKKKSDDYVKHIIKGHETVVASAITARDTAGDNGDKETEDLVISRIQEHQKALWMLGAYMKDL